MGGLETLIPAGGVGGVLAAVVLYLLRANAVDRRDYQHAVDRAEKRTEEMAARMLAAHQATDEQRVMRRAAEDAYSALGRELAEVRRQLGEQMEKQTRALAKIEERLP